MQLRGLFAGVVFGRWQPRRRSARRAKGPRRLQRVAALRANSRFESKRAFTGLEKGRSQSAGPFPAAENVSAERFGPNPGGAEESLQLGDPFPRRVDGSWEYPSLFTSMAKGPLQLPRPFLRGERAPSGDHRPSATGEEISGNPRQAFTAEERGGAHLDILDAMRRAPGRDMASTPTAPTSTAQDSTARDQPPEVTAEPGWIPVEPPNLESGRGSFVSGEPAEGRLRVRYFRRQEDQRLVGRAWFGSGAEGPPGHAHGGATAAVMDEAMGSSAWLAGYPVVAAHIEVDFRALLPLGTDAYLEAWVDRVEGRKVFVRSRLAAGPKKGDVEQQEGKTSSPELYAESRGLFVILDPERFGKHLGPVAEALGMEPAELLARMRAAVTGSPAAS